MTELSLWLACVGRISGDVRLQARRPLFRLGRMLLIVGSAVLGVWQPVEAQGATSSCEVTFGIDGSSFTALQFDVSYDPNALSFGPEGVSTACEKLTEITVTAAYDHRSNGKLSIGLVSAGPIAAGDIMGCTFTSSVGPLESDAFSVTVLDEFGAGSPGAGSGVCGAPSTGAQRPFARDALTTMRKITGIAECRLCECDTDESSSVTFFDVLAVLGAAIGNPGRVLSCGPSCDPEHAGVLPIVTDSVHVTSVGCHECGNNAVENGEECDDGNLADGDGCSSDCTIENDTTTSTTTTTTTENSTTTSITTTTTTSPPGIVCGDVNVSGSITATDALAILKTAVGGDQCTAVPCTCDVNGNGTITASDALATLKSAVSHEELNGCPCQ